MWGNEYIGSAASSDPRCCLYICNGCMDVCMHSYLPSRVCFGVNAICLNTTVLLYALHLGMTLNTVSAKIGTISRPGPGRPSVLPANPLSSQLEHAHLPDPTRNTYVHILPGHPLTLLPVAFLKQTSRPQPRPERMKKLDRGRVLGTGDIDNSPREW